MLRKILLHVMSAGIPALVLQMGCAPATIQSVHKDVAAVIPRFPAAELMPGTGQGTAHIIVVKGKNLLFNPAPVMDDKWFNGRMTQDDYVKAINSLNDTTAEAVLHYPSPFTIVDIPKENAITAINARIEALNKIWTPKSVLFTLENGGQHHSAGEFPSVDKRFAVEDWNLYIKID